MTLSIRFVADMCVFKLLDIRPFFPSVQLCFYDQDSNVKEIRELRMEIQRLKSIIASGNLVRTQDNLSDLHNDYMLHSPFS